jgi:hypothetical protein
MKLQVYWQFLQITQTLIGIVVDSTRSSSNVECVSLIRIHEILKGAV